MHLVFVAAVAAPLAAFVLLAVKAWQKDAFAWDAELAETVRANGEKETFLNRSMDLLGFVLHPAMQLAGALLVLGVVLALVARGRGRAALLLGLSVSGAVIGAPLVKELFENSSVSSRDAGYSFPSGHALRTMTAAAAIMTVAWPTAWRWTTMVLSAVSVVLIGVALVYHEWHWASDVIGGWCLGVAWVACVWLAVRPLYPARAGGSR
jgi:membrane-associated phospholipid phosphatase